MTLAADPVTGSGLLPLREPVIDRLPRPVSVRALMPLRAVLRAPQDPVDHLTVITPSAAALRIHARQQQFQPFPLLIAYLVASPQ